MKAKQTYSSIRHRKCYSCSNLTARARNSCHVFRQNCLTLIPADYSKRPKLTSSLSNVQKLSLVAIQITWTHFFGLPKPTVASCLHGFLETLFHSPRPLFVRNVRNELCGRSSSIKRGKKQITYHTINLMQCWAKKEPLRGESFLKFDHVAKWIEQWGLRT